MSTINELYPSDRQPDMSRQGNNITHSQTWTLKTASRITPVRADLLVYALGNINIYNFPGAPGVSTHPDNQALICTGWKSKRHDGGSERTGYVFTITVQFTNSNISGTASEDPTDADPIYRSEKVRVEKEITKDPIKGVLIASTNGQLIFPRLTKNKLLKRILIRRNERDYNDDRALVTEDKLNSDVVHINGVSYDPRVLLLEKWHGEPEFDSLGNSYYIVDYEFLVDPDNLHQTDLLDVSTERDLDENLPPRAIPGKQVTQPDKLDGNGRFLSKDDQKNPEKFTVLQFHTNEETPMDFLGFGVQQAGLNLGTIPRRL